MLEKNVRVNTNCELKQGVLKNWKVAVKKLAVSKDLSDAQFLDEVTCLMTTNHKNIVRFLGYCADAKGKLMKIHGNYKVVQVPKRLLCFEYVPNGNIDHYLKGMKYAAVFLIYSNIKVKHS